MKILVTGAGGQLGQELQALAERFPTYQFSFHDRSTLDLGDPVRIASVIGAARADYCINAGAYTAVDKAESEPDAAFRVNADGVGALAAACADAGTRLLHLSTDYVFDGSANTPYREEDPTGPIGVYGASKRAGEELCLRVNPDAVIIRTAWVYSAFGHNFVKTMLRLMPQKESLSIVDDQQGCPTYAADLAAALLHIIGSGTWVPGIFHYSNDGPTTWYRFAAAVKAHCGFSCVLRPIATDQYPTPAARPAWSVLDTGKIRNTYGLNIRNWSGCLSECLALLRCGQPL
ncbi:dTDP-4-dehydrorhamnose reductase [Flaviaesturariibacter amylovorans]|uniref:dTDP-4-dehydrorhamnose reductase n=1 Tax=Flaviaesturariibacter amylovorans TaxID=1084520 RepID=A0ABP8GKE4_9BACT